MSGAQFLVLDVVRDGHDWKITGLQGGKSIRLYLHARYPESEWPEVLSISAAKDMHRALYDEWQVSDELAAEAKRGDGILFRTPMGDFVTVGVDVVTAENAPRARAAHKAYEEISAKIDQGEAEVMERAGFGRARVKQISTQYGHRFEDWPKALADGYWKAYRRAMEATEPLRKKLRERDY